LRLHTSSNLPGINKSKGHLFRKEKVTAFYFRQKNGVSRIFLQVGGYTNFDIKCQGGNFMAKRRLSRERNDIKKLIPQMEKMRFKGDLADDERPENYEFAEEFARNNPLKTPPNNLTSKNKETEEKG